MGTGGKSHGGGAIPSISSFEARCWSKRWTWCLTRSIIDFFLSKICTNSFSTVDIFQSVSMNPPNPIRERKQTHAHRAKTKERGMSAIWDERWR